MLSWSKTKLHQCRLSSLFHGVLVDAIEVTGTQSLASLRHCLAGKTVLSCARNFGILSHLRTCSRLDVLWSIYRTEAFSTISGSILLQARDPAKLNEQIQIAVNEHKCDEAWRLFEQRMQMEGMIPYEEFYRDRKFSKLEAEAKDVLGTLLAKLRVQVELITTEHGVLQPTEEIYVKLAKAFLESGKMKELAEFLIQAEYEDSPVSSDNSMLVNVINARISLGMLDQTHDLLDEMRGAKIRTSASVYSSLLKAYCKKKKPNKRNDIALKRCSKGRDSITPELLRSFNPISSDSKRFSRSSQHVQENERGENTERQKSVV